MSLPDYYEFLQISPNADLETIHRVYRYLASRYHPDNPKTGDPAKFELLREAHNVLSNRATRAEYNMARQRETPNQDTPEVSLAEIEDRMGFPRDYLEFTSWYLQKKGYITRADNSDFTLTAEGVDFVENQRVVIPTLNKMLTDGTDRLTEG